MSIKTWKEGLIVKINLPKGGIIYGRLLKFPLIQYFKNYNSIEKKLEGKMFELWTMNNSKKSMEKIEQTELNNEDKIERRFFKYDLISKKIYIYSNEIETPATKEEIKDLENAAVWDLVHIEERFTAEINGKESIFKRSLDQIKFG